MPTYYSTHEYASHCVQKLIEISETSEHKDIIDILSPTFEVLFYSSIGNHVVQKMIMYLDYDSKEKIHSYIIKNIVSLTTNNRSISVITRYITSFSQSIIELQRKFELKEAMIKNFETFANQKYAHFAIVSLLNSWSHQEVTEVLELLCSEFKKFSSQKFSSKIIKNCFENNQQKVI